MRLSQPQKKDDAALTLQERAVLHYALMQMRDGLFSESINTTAIALNSSRGSISRHFDQLVRKGAFEIVERNRQSTEGVPLPSVYRPIMPESWKPVVGVPPVEQGASTKGLHNEGLHTMNSSMNIHNQCNAVNSPNGLYPLTGGTPPPTGGTPPYSTGEIGSHFTSETGSANGHPDPRIISKNGKLFLKRGSND